MIRPTMLVLRLAQRLTLAIFCADFLTMLAMNCLRLRPAATPWIFFPLTMLFLIASAGSISNSKSAISAHDVRRLTVLALTLGLLCALTRWAYLFEGIHRQLAPMVGDDAWHIQELNSLVNSPRYPVRSSFNPVNYLSFYYAAWMPAVALYFLLPFRCVTLSTVLFAVNALYDLLLPLSLLGFAIARARSGLQVKWAVYLIGFWSGLQSFYSLFVPFSDASWPLRDLFGFDLQFSNFATLLIWVVHHLCSAVALLLACAIWNGERGVRRVSLCSVLLAFSMYSSVFVLLGALPFLVYLGLRELRDSTRAIGASLVLTGALTAPMLWMFLWKPANVGFQFPLQHGPAFYLRYGLKPPAVHWVYGYWSGFALFLALLATQFFFVVWSLWRGRRTLSAQEKSMAAISIAFLLSTYFIGFSGANNYCIRGSIVPVFVMTWIASAHLPRPRPIVGMVFLLGALGTGQTLSFHLLRSVVLTVRPMPYLSDSAAILAINQDRSHTAVDLTAVPGVDHYPADLPYYVQKMRLQPWPVVAPSDEDLQSLGPKGPWAWQRHSLQPALNSLPQELP